MSKRILRYAVPVSDQPYTLWMGQQIVHVGQQSSPDELVLWAVRDTDLPPVLKTFYVVGTGHVWPVDHPGPGRYTHVATVQAYHGMVWHLLEQVGP